VGSTGKVLGISDKSAIFATRGQGNRLEDRVKISLEHLAFGMRGVENARALLDDAADHGDTATVRVTTRGGVVYEKEQQKHRLRREARQGIDRG
jgi:hypothetical protein